MISMYDSVDCFVQPEDSMIVFSKPENSKLRAMAFRALIERECINPWSTLRVWG